MPSDRRTGAVLDHGDLLELVRAQPGESGRDLAHRHEEGWNRIGALELLLIEVVTPPIRNDSALPFKAAKLEGFEGKRRDLLQQPLFFVLGNRVRQIGEPFRTGLDEGIELRHFIKLVALSPLPSGSKRPPRYLARNASAAAVKTRLFSGRANPCPSSGNTM